jgi:hypothetical protein
LVLIATSNFQSRIGGCGTEKSGRSAGGCGAARGRDRDALPRGWPWNPPARRRRRRGRSSARRDAECARRDTRPRRDCGRCSHGTARARVRSAGEAARAPRRSAAASRAGASRDSRDRSGRSAFASVRESEPASPDVTERPKQPQESVDENRAPGGEGYSRRRAPSGVAPSHVTRDQPCDQDCQIELARHRLDARQPRRALIGCTSAARSSGTKTCNR